MSEHQIHTFRAIDGPLSQAAMDNLRLLSKSADITPRGLSAEYHGGDFKGDPEKLMLDTFDAYVFSANWRHQRLAFRFPRQGVDLRSVQQYTWDATDFGHVAGLHVETTRSHVTIWWEIAGEDKLSDYSAPWLQAFLPIRQDLAAGDYRSLYLSWLFAVQHEQLPGDTVEPPVPALFHERTKMYHRLARFIGVERALMEAARVPSTGRRTVGDLQDLLPEGEALLLKRQQATKKRREERLRAEH